MQNGRQPLSTSKCACASLAKRGVRKVPLASFANSGLRNSFLSVAQRKVQNLQCSQFQVFVELRISVFPLRFMAVSCKSPKPRDLSSPHPLVPNDARTMETSLGVSLSIVGNSGPLPWHCYVHLLLKIFLYSKMDDQICLAFLVISIQTPLRLVLPTCGGKRGKSPTNSLKSMLPRLGWELRALHIV